MQRLEVSGAVRPIYVSLGVKRLIPGQLEITFCKSLRKCSQCGNTYFHTSRVNEQRNILHEIRKRKANWIGHILCRNCLLKQVIEGKIKGQTEVTRRRGRRRKKLLDDLKDRRG